LISEETQLAWVRKVQRLVIDRRAQLGENWLGTLTPTAFSAYRLAVNAICHWISLADLPDKRSWRDGMITTGSRQPDLLRDIFGPLPFRPVALDPAWLTPAVIGLAQRIYTEKAFDQLPALAEALVKAGCQAAEILAHCRSEGPHVKGCWVVDLLTGKA
jgi:hypothetical protein